MRVISTPLRLRLAVVTLFASVPLVVIEALIASRLPWWKVPYTTVGFWAVAMLLICIPFAAWLLNGKRWAFVLSVVFAGLWLLVSLAIAAQKRNPSVGFFTIFLGLYLLLLLLWIKGELDRSYFDPRLAWYQGLPQPVAGLKCKVSAQERQEGADKNEYLVSRLDEEGAFVFASPASTASLKLSKGKKFELVFSRGGRKVACLGTPMRELGQGRGSGFQFRDLTPDLRKELGDFVEALRGEGYVP